MKFHIGLPTHDDFDGVYFTATSLLTHHKDRVAAITVVDNAPEIELCATKLREWCAQVGIRYVPLFNPKGPCGAKELCFRVNPLPTVCLDSHVLLALGALDALAAAWVDGPALYQGPLMNENGTVHATHLKDEWGTDGMRGKWGRDDTLLDGVREIGAHGCGLIACDPKHWPGFNPDFRGFGGEEWYIQDKMRLRGGKVYSVGGLRWIHRWACIRPGGITHSPKLFDKARNQWLGHKELGRDPETVVPHFPQVPDDQWKIIRNGGEGPTMACGSCKTVGSAFKTPGEWHKANKTDDRYSHATGVTLDVGRNFDKSVPGILAAGVTNLTVVHPMKPAVVERFGATWVKGDSITTDPVGCDTLVIGDHGSTINLKAELARWSPVVARRIVIPFRDGMLDTIMAFVRANREWTVFKHAPGWVVLSCHADDKVKPPALVSVGSAWRLAQALGKHLVDGGRKVPLEVFNQRMDECDMCTMRNGDRCGACGCYVSSKGAMASQACPLDKWLEYKETK